MIFIFLSCEALWSLPYWLLQCSTCYFIGAHHCQCSRWGNTCFHILASTLCAVAPVSCKFCFALASASAPCQQESCQLLYYLWSCDAADSCDDASRAAHLYIVVSSLPTLPSPHISFAWMVLAASQYVTFSAQARVTAPFVRALRCVSGIPT